MDKEELLNNLKGHQKQTESFGWKVGISGGLVVLGVVILIWLKPFEGHAFDDRMIAGVLLLIFIVPFLFFSTRHEKVTDRKYKMFCAACGKRHNQALLPIAVLENQCQECGAKIYDT